MRDVITSFEAGRSRSWVDPIGAAELSSLVCRELGRKFQAVKDRGGKVYFVTLTYGPAQWLPDGVSWEDATEVQRLAASEKCWDAMTEDRHVHHFIQRLEVLTGIDLSGRWWSKREFTKNGFLHHHLIIDGPEFMPFDQVHEAWGFGRIDAQVARSEAGLAWYVGKYCTKYGDEPPAWIFDRPAGSLRFTTCSDGWWSSDLGQVKSARRVTGAARRVPGRSDSQEDKAYGCFETVGMRINRKSNSVTVRCNGQRDEIQGVTLEDFRRYRDPSYSQSVIKARRSMDAVTGVGFSQAVNELRFIGSIVRSGGLSPVDGAASVPDAGTSPGAFSGPSPRGIAGGVACLLPSSLEAALVPASSSVLTGRQGNLFVSEVDAGAVAEAAERSEAVSAEVPGVAWALLTLSSPQECGYVDEVEDGFDHDVGPPDG